MFLVPSSGIVKGVDTKFAISVSSFFFFQEVAILLFFQGSAVLCTVDTGV
jgi:hypothetical protein